jgi:hypothetical protein
MNPDSRGPVILDETSGEYDENCYTIPFQTVLSKTRPVCKAYFFPTVPRCFETRLLHGQKTVHHVVTCSAFVV